MQFLASDPRGPGSSLGVLCLFICSMSFHWLEGPLWPPDHRKEDFPKSGLSLDGREFLQTRTPGPLEADEVPTRLARLAMMWLGGLGLGGLTAPQNNIAQDQRTCCRVSRPLVVLPKVDTDVTFPENLLCAQQHTQCFADIIFCLALTSFLSC